MVNYCNDDGCNKIACFNHENEIQGAYCKQHKLPEMRDVKHKTCVYKDCLTRPHFNIRGAKSGLYCNTHKNPDMVNIASKSCQHEGCTIRPSYNYHDKKSGIYCDQHKLPDMVNVGNRQKKCREPNCKKRAGFNFQNQTKPLYCAKHKLDDMINIVEKKCESTDCKIIAKFNFPGSTVGICCITHKKPGMIDIRNKTCKTRLCDVRANPNPQYKGYCTRCFLHTFPDEPITRNYKVKERHVTDYIKEKFPGFQFIYDKRTGGCSWRRPDIFVDMLTHVVIIEINEFKHDKYDTTCEQVRLNELFEDFGFRPIVFIMFNPDDYIDAHGIEIKSCFKVDVRTGILVIARNKKTEWRLRLERLRDAVEHHLTHIPKDNEFEHLYYDA